MEENIRLMKTKEFKNKVVEVTLKSMNKNPLEWVTFNDGLNSKIIDDDYVNLDFTLLNEELPIFECKLIDSQVIITTERIISTVKGKYDELLIEQISDFLDDYGSENFKPKNGLYPKTNKFAILKKNEEKLIYIVDSLYPSYFANMLIKNIFSFKQSGQWFINPKTTIPYGNYDTIFKTLKDKGLNIDNLQDLYAVYKNYKSKFSSEKKMSLDEYDKSLDLLNNLNEVLISLIDNNFE